MLKLTLREGSDNILNSQTVQVTSMTRSLVEFWNQLTRSDLQRKNCRGYWFWPYNISLFSYRNVASLTQPRVVEGDRGDQRETVRLSEETTEHHNNHLRARARPITVGRFQTTVKTTLWSISPDKQEINYIFSEEKYIFHLRGCWICLLLQSQQTNLTALSPQSFTEA